MKKRTKIIWMTVCLLAGILLIAACWPARTDLGESDIYSETDRKEAANLIAQTIESFEGCRLYKVRYDGDEISLKNLDYCNELSKDGTVYEDAIVFTSYFRSPIFGGGAWNANSIYSWSWYLARTVSGQWEIMAYGYA